MFSFFKSKKHTPTPSPPNEPIPSAASVPGPDDFIFIDRRDDPRQQNPENIYPYSPPRIPQIIQPVNFLQGVPFKLSAEITASDENSTEISKFQVDEIEAFIGRMNITSDYDFALEREIVSQG